MKREIVAVALGDLHPDSGQPRREFSAESLEGLGRTLASGQLQPVLVYRGEKGLTILDGERRWRAAEAAGLKSIDVVVVEKPATDAQRLEAQLIANLAREDLSPLEKARAIDQVIRLTGRSAGEVAGRLGLSAPTVSRLLALLTLEPELQERLERGEIDASTAYELAKIRESSVRVELGREAARAKLTRRAVQERTRALKGGRELRAASARRGPRVAVPLPGGRRAWITGGSVTFDALLALLEKALTKLRPLHAQGIGLSDALLQLHYEQ